MAVEAWVPLSTITLSSSASLVTFSSIPNNFRDLRLIVKWYGTVNTQGNLKFNGDGGANYSIIGMSATGSTPSTGSVSASNGVNIAAGATISTTQPGLFTVDILDYAANDKHKIALHRFAAPIDVAATQAFRWANSTPINSVSVSSNYASGAVLSLWGLRVG